MKGSISILKSPSQPSTSGTTINNKSIEDHKIGLTFAFSKENLFQSLSQEIISQDILQDPSVLLDEYNKAKDCLSTIEDPLWKRVCQDVIKTMGPASFLEIWACILGETTHQNKSIDIDCPTEKAAQFIQQYSFVILGSLKTYFPAIKQINIKNNSSLEKI